MRALTLVSVVAMTTALAGCVVAPAAYENPPTPTPEYASSTDQITSPPPPIPVYDQPPCPVAGYIWTPGIWQWGPEGYFWVPGTWVGPPAVGLLWTPGFWDLAAGVYFFHAGYWGPHVGFYGGINYGFGYVGTGYAGGRWVNNDFHYNTAVTNINNTVIHNTYNQTIVNNINVTNVTNVTRVSYAGGPGTRSAPNHEEAAAAREAHVPPTSVQVQHAMTARSNPVLAATHNEGRPPIAATANAREFSGAGVMAAKPIGSAYNPTSPPVARNTQSGPFVHARDVPARPAEQSEAAEQEQLSTRQEQERQTLAQQQEREHESFPSQSTHDHQAYETMERQHQQQTSQMQQRHQQQREQVSRSRPQR